MGRSRTIVSAVASGLGIFALALVTASAPRQSDAHPHVWLDTTFELLVESERVHAARVYWTFDEFFSALMLEDFDKDGDGTLDDGAAALLFEQVLEPLREYSYFTHLHVDGAKVVVEGVEDFDATAEDQRVTFGFTVPLPRAIDPRETLFSIALYDESYYVELYIDEQTPGRVDAAWMQSCAFEAALDKDNPIYFDSFYPLAIYLRCAGT